MTASKFYDLVIDSVQPETEQAIKVSFAVPDELRDIFRYQPGQYLTLQLKLEDELLRRSYSICSGINDDQMQVAIKRVTGGRFSNFANDSLSAGSLIQVLPPQGSFFRPLDASKARQYLFIAAGSGITPVISNIKSILEQEPKSSVVLLFGNQRSNTIMFRETLGFIKNKYLTQFHWVNILSREDQGIALLNGRLDNNKGNALNQQLIRLGDYNEYFICGPESMISEVSRGLRGIGVAEAHIHYELFASSAEDARAAMSKHQARTEAYGGKINNVKVVMDGRTSQFELTSDGENILDAGLSHGIDLPYSCKQGTCATCRASLITGEVDVDITHGLTEAEIKAGFILTCQSHPISDEVVVDFDKK